MVPKEEWDKEIFLPFLLYSLFKATSKLPPMFCMSSTVVEYPLQYKKEKKSIIALKKTPLKPHWQPQGSRIMKHYPTHIPGIMNKNKILDQF